MNELDLTILQREIASTDDVESALAILSWVKLRRIEIDAEWKRQLAEAKSAAQASAVLEFAGTTFTFDEVEKSLTAALREFAQAQRDSLFPTKRKTAKFAHGEIKARKRTATVSLAEGHTEEDVLLRLAEQPRFTRTKKAIDFAAIKSDREKGLLTDAQLEELGLVYDPGEGDEYSVHPAK